jgi:hypothetical protein
MYKKNPLFLQKKADYNKKYIMNIKQIVYNYPKLNQLQLFD